MDQTPMDDFLVGPFSMTSISSTHPFQMDGHDSSEISRLSMSQLPCPQELRFPDDCYADSLQISDTYSFEWTAQIMSGFSTWISPISCPWECRFPDAPQYRWVLDLHHVSLLTDGSDLLDVSRLWMSRFSRPRELRFSECRYPDGSTPCRDFSSCSQGLNSLATSTYMKVVSDPTPDLTTQLYSPSLRSFDC